MVWNLWSNGLSSIIQSPPRKVQEQHAAEDQHQQGENTAQADVKAATTEDLRNGEENMVAATIPEITVSAVEERWTTDAEEKQETEQLLQELGAQAVLNMLGDEVSARTKLLQKLVLYEQEVKLGHQLLEQKQTLLRSKQALILMSRRIKYNVCHRLKRGGVIKATKSVLDKEVQAARQRLGLQHSYKQFNIEEMLSTINRLAPEGKYLSSKPAPVPAATTRPCVRRPFIKKEKPSVRYFAAPIPSVPIQQRGERIARAQLGTASHCPRQTSAATGYGGDYGIVSDGDDFNREPFYDLVTQLPQDDTCLQYPAESIDQGLFCDIMEEQQFPNFEASVEDCDYLDVRWRTVTSLTLRWRTVTSLTLRWRTVHAMMLMRTMATMLWTTPLTR